MINEKKLNNFILTRLAITLLIIGVFQIVSDTFFANIVRPVLGEILGTDFLAATGFAEGFLFVLEVLLSFVINPELAIKITGWIGRFFNLQVDNSVYNEAFNHIRELEPERALLYMIMVVLICLTMLIVWIFPYIFGGILFAVSVSKRVKILEKQRIDKEEEATRQRNLLLSDVAHDIKTPITTIAGFSQALSEGRVEPEKEQEYLDAIKAKSMQTVDMVTLLFEYVKLDSEGYKLQKSTEDICEIFRNSVANLYTDFEEKDMELDIDIPDEGIFMQVDRLQMQRVFNNLLINAFKHNPEKTKLTLSVEKLGKWISFKVSDNGTWIESETARHIFDPFVQGDKSRTGKRGTGLGLSITKKIVEMHDGRIRLIQYKDRTPYTKTFEIQLLAE